MKLFDFPNAKFDKKKKNTVDEKITST